MDRNELFVRLARIIAADGGLLLNGWKHLVLVIAVGDGAVDVTGFCYTNDDRAVPVSPTDVGIFDAIKTLRKAMADADDGRAWVAALFRVSQGDGQLRAEFEYVQKTRWTVTPANVKSRASEFRP